MSSTFATDDQFEAEQRTIRRAALLLLFLAFLALASGVAGATCYLVR